MTQLIDNLGRSLDAADDGDYVGRGAWRPNSNLDLSCPGYAWLRRLVGDPSYFLDSVQGRRPHQHGPDELNFGDLFSLGELQRLVIAGKIPAETMRMVRHGRAVRGASLGEADCGEGARSVKVTSVQVARWLAAGHTLAVSDIQRLAPKLASICSELGQLVACEIVANAYLTPPSSRGFNTHYDDHDVIVIQIAGSKDWRVFADPVADFAVDGGPRDVAVDDSESVAISASLTAGQVIYIPGGFAHDATCVSEHSLHVTLGFMPCHAKAMNPTSLDSSL